MNVKSLACGTVLKESSHEIFICKMYAWQQEPSIYAKYLEFAGSKDEKSILPKYSRRWKFGWSPGTANRLSYLQDNTFFVTEFRRSLRQKKM